MKCGYRIVGLIGGMGPYADIDIVRRVRDLRGAKMDQEHVPIILASFPSEIVDRSRFIMEKKGKNPGEEIYRILKMLETMGAEVMGIACVTAHSPVIFNRIKELMEGDNLNVKIVHIIEELGRYLKENYDISKVGILSTYGAYLGGAFNLLEKYDIEPVFPEERVRNLVHEAIYHPELGIKANPMGTDYSVTNITIAIENLRERGLKTIVLGCTEIPLIIKKRRIGDVNLIAINDVLSRALLRESCKENMNQQSR